jgi:hypothetical protein
LQVAHSNFSGSVAGVMKNEFRNRLTSFTTTLAFLDAAGNTGIWLNQPPLVFTSKVGVARSMVEGLREFCRRQGVLTTGGDGG